MAQTAQTATTSLSNWNAYNYHVQSELKGGEFINAETTLIAAGPPELKHAMGTSNTSQETMGDFAFPIGVLENVGLSQSKQLQRIFEIGSNRSYFVPGRVVGSVSIGRVIYYGPSLLKTLYSYIQFANGSQFTSGMATADKNLVGPTYDAGYKIRVAPGYGDLLLNLGSDMFNQPFGLVIYFRNQLEDNTSAIYLEDCYVQGHQLSISSGSVLVMEGASLQYDRLLPIRLSVKSVA